MKKIISTMLVAVMFLALLTQPALGANNVTDITVEVVIDEDGSAMITQTWNCKFTEGTEGYIPIENLGEMSLSAFRVSDVSGAYTTIDNWNVDASFEEKARKCGILKTYEGYELCWGISEYGETRYAIEYKINNFVGAYDDFDGFNFQFVNSGMGILPTDVTVKILMKDGTKLGVDNAGIWAFGFDGQINFDQDQILAYTEKPLSSGSDSVIIMVQLNKGLIIPTKVVAGSFQDVKEKAFVGSDYDDAGAGGTASELPKEDYGFMGTVMGFMLLMILVIPFAILLYILSRKWKRKLRIATLYKNADYFRETPIAGNLEATFALARAFQQTNNDGNIIRAAFLQLINAGCLESITEKSVGLFGKEKEEISLRLVQPPEFTGVTVNSLYDLLVQASSDDQVLQKYELENYSRRNHRVLLSIIEAAKQDGTNTLTEIDSYDSSKKAKPLKLSQRGEILLSNIMGFKKYLLEFSLIGERSIAESVIWQDYLTFATLLGIADKAIEQFEKVYPDVTEVSRNARHYYLLAHRYGKASYESAQLGRSNGRGGRSSFGGGGGFGGGGHGGGTR